MSGQYFPFNPARHRRGFLACALLAAVPAVLAVRSALRGEGMPASVRAGMCVGLAAASVAMAHRLRRREGWGVTLDPEGLALGRASGGPPLRVPWSKVDFARPVGRTRAELALFWGPGKRVVVSERLFARREDFQALVLAVERYVPPPTYDA